MDFSAHNIPDNVFRMNNIISMKKSDIESMGEDGRYPFISVVPFADCVHLMVSMPKAWFNSVDEFKSQVFTGEMTEFKAAMHNLRKDKLLSLIDVLRFSSLNGFFDYLPYDALFEYDEETSTIYSEMDPIMTEVYKAICTCKFCSDYFKITDAKQRYDYMDVASDVQEGILIVGVSARNIDIDELSDENKLPVYMASICTCPVNLQMRLENYGYPPCFELWDTAIKEVFEYYLKSLLQPIPEIVKYEDLDENGNIKEGVDDEEDAYVTGIDTTEQFQAFLKSMEIDANKFEQQEANGEDTENMSEDTSDVANLLNDIVDPEDTQ